MQQEKYAIVGTAPLMMHNIQLANPLNSYAKQIKAITSKKKKTEQDLLDIFELEWRGGLYYNSEHGVYIEGVAIEACLLGAAKLNKRGQDLKRGLRVLENYVSLKYDGPKDPDKMYHGKDGVSQFVDVRAVRVNQSRTMRCRPIFNQWSCEFTVQYNEEILNAADVTSMVVNGGKLIGLMEHRPRYGLYNVRAG
jgi:hypothetical protein